MCFEAQAQVIIHASGRPANRGRNDVKHTPHRITADILDIADMSDSVHRSSKDPDISDGQDTP
jgi:hypothetical protein